MSKLPNKLSLSYSKTRTFFSILFVTPAKANDPK